MRWGICIIKFNWFNKLLNSLTFIMLSAICISIKSYRYTISQQVFRPFNRLHVFLQHCFLAIVTNSSLSLPSFCYSNRIFEIINSSKIQFLFCSLCQRRYHNLKYCGCERVVIVNHYHIRVMVVYERKFI